MTIVGNIAHKTQQLAVRKIHTEKRWWYIPTCHEEHWVFLRTGNKTRTITQYDPLTSNKRKHYGEYVQSQISYHANEQWTLGTGRMAQQKNGFDCGVFVIDEIQKLVRRETGNYGEDEPSRERVHNILTKGSDNLIYTRTNVHKGKQKSKHKRIKKNIDSRDEAKKV